MRWILGLIGAGALMLALAVGLLFLIPSDRVAAIASREFEQATGRAMSFRGTIRPTLWPLGVRTGAVEIANAPWSIEGPMVSADALSVGVALWPILRGEVRLDQVRVEHPRVLLERDATGRGNWEVESQPRPDISLAHVTISGGRLTYIDRRTLTRHVADDVDADLTLPGASGVGHLDLAAVVGGESLRLTAASDDVGAFLSGTVTPLTLRITGPGSGMAFTGRAGMAPLAADGLIDLRLQDPGRLMAALWPGVPWDVPGGVPWDVPGGVPGDVWPDWTDWPDWTVWPDTAVTLNAQATWTAERSFHLRDGRIMMNGEAIAIAADLTTGANRPRLEAEVTAGTLDLSPLLPARGQGDAWSTLPIAYRWLAPVDARVALNAGTLRLGGLEFNPARLVLALDRGRATADLREVRAYGGEVTGEVALNGRDGLSVGADLRLGGVEIGPPVKGLSGFDGLSGRLDGSLRLLAVGTTVAVMMNSLSGQGMLALDQGAIKGFDLPGALQGGALLDARGTTAFDRATASFRISEGILRGDDLMMVSPLLTTRGSGIIGIGARTLNMRLEPEPSTEARTALRAGRIRAPILISGTWAEPLVRLAVQSVADEAVAHERQRLDAEDPAGDAAGENR